MKRLYRPFGLFGLALALGSCTGGLAPLDAPIPGESIVSNGLRLVVGPGDMAQLAETVRLLAGHQIDLAMPPQTVPGTAATRSAFTATVVLDSSKAEWTAEGILSVKLQVAPLALAMSLATVGNPACTFGWKSAGGTATVQVSLQKGALGPQTILIAQPTVEFSAAGLVDFSSCATAFPKGEAPAVHLQIVEALRAALGSRIGPAATQVMHTAFPPRSEISGQFAVDGEPGLPRIVRLSATFASPDASLVERHLGFGVATLNVGLTVDRHACAVDTPLPADSGSVQLLPTEGPAAKTVLRRGLALDAALLRRLVWAWARAGAWCRESSGPLEGLSADVWPSQLVPELAPWIDGAPARARLWPHSSPSVSVVDGLGGPELAWVLEDASLELTGRLAGVEAVVLTVRGRLQGHFKPVVTAGGRLALQLTSATSASAVVTSPLFGQQALSSSHGASGLDSVVDAAVRGIFSPVTVLPLEPILPPGTVVTAVGHGGDCLWVWLDGGLGSP